MEPTQITDLIFNNGIGIAVIVYFMFRDFKFMDSLSKTLASLSATLEQLQDFVTEMRIEYGKEQD